MEKSETTARRGKKKSSVEKAWKQHGLETYRNTVNEMVHFNVKTINSNAKSTGIRINKDAAVNLPYISARTLLHADVELALDYAKGGAAVSGVVSQIYGIIEQNDFALAATKEEKEAIHQAMKEANENFFSFGTESVDSRLRQLLIPHPDAERGYVAVTPITSNGLCHYLMDSQTGLVALHNEKAFEEAKTARSNRSSRQYRRIRQAQFGLGGANPQNVGRLVRSMQRPIFVSGPALPQTSRRAFSIYHRGISIDFTRPGHLRNQLIEYRDYRESLRDEDGNITTNMKKRDWEEKFMQDICESILDLGKEAFDVLRENLDVIPELKALSEEDRYDPGKWLPGKVSHNIRGLIIPQIRKEGNWPQEMASFIVESMAKATETVKGEESELLQLDGIARSTLVVILRRLLEKEIPQ